MPALIASQPFPQCPINDRQFAGALVVKQVAGMRIAVEHRIFRLAENSGTATSASISCSAIFRRRATGKRAAALVTLIPCSSVSAVMVVVHEGESGAVRKLRERAIERSGFDQRFLLAAKVDLVAQAAAELCRKVSGIR